MNCANGHSNVPGTIFCTTCGAMIGSKSAQGNFAGASPYGSISEASPLNQFNSYPTPLYSQPPAKKKTGLIIGTAIGGVAVLLTLVLAIGFSSKSNNSSNPSTSATAAEGSTNSESIGSGSEMSDSEFKSYLQDEYSPLLQPIASGLKKVSIATVSNNELLVQSACLQLTDPISALSSLVSTPTGRSAFDLISSQLVDHLNLLESSCVAADFVSSSAYMDLVSTDIELLTGLIPN